VSNTLTVLGPSNLATTTIEGDATITGTTTSENLTVSNTLTVLGPSNLATTTIEGDVTITGTTTTENLTVSNTLTVLGPSYLATTTIEGDATITGTTTLEGALVDGNGEVGEPGQLLSTTGTETVWIDNFAPTSGTVTNATLRWDGSQWVETTTLLQTDSATGTATLAANATVTGTLTVQGTTTLATTTLTAGLADADGDFGTEGQVLSTTGTRTNWITLSSGLVTQTTTNYTASLEETTIYVQPSAGLTITLPTPTLLQNGETITIKRINAYDGIGDTLEVVSAAMIEASISPLLMNVGYQGYTLQAFGGNWFIIQRF